MAYQSLTTVSRFGDYGTHADGAVLSVICDWSISGPADYLNALALVALNCAPTYFTNDMMGGDFAAATIAAFEDIQRGSMTALAALLAEAANGESGVVEIERNRRPWEPEAKRYISFLIKREDPRT